MIQFEVGKVYRQSDGSLTFIKVTKRVENRVWFHFVTLDGGSYSLGFVWKKVSTSLFGDCESITLDVGVLGETFFATDEVDFGYECRKHLAKKADAERKNSSRKEAEVAKLAEWLASEGISMETVDKVLARFSGVSWDVLSCLRDKMAVKEA